ncbi:MAG TPA: nucleotidyltransferase domain-containing protein [Acidobacteriota bacterium]
MRTKLAALLRDKPVHQVILFGSRARRQEDAYSDTDLVLIADSARPFPERFRDFWELIYEIPPPVELMIYTPEEFRRLQEEENSFIMNVLDHGLIVYERSS